MCCLKMGGVNGAMIRIIDSPSIVQELEAVLDAEMTLWNVIPRLASFANSIFKPPFNSSNNTICTKKKVNQPEVSSSSSEAEQSSKKVN